MLGFPEKMRDKNIHIVVSVRSKFGRLQTEHTIPMALDAVVVQASLSLQTRSGIVGVPNGYPVWPRRKSPPTIAWGWQRCPRTRPRAHGASSHTEASPQVALFPEHLLPVSFTCSTPPGSSALNSFITPSQKPFLSPASPLLCGLS